MSARFWFAPLILALAAVAPFHTAAPPAVAAAAQDPQNPVTTTLDDQAELAVTDLQLRHRARPRRSQPPDRARHVGSALHGHRRHRQSGDRAFPIADRAVARERARAELRVRPARARQAAAQVRRPRRHADPHASRRQHDARGGSEGAPAQLQQRAGLGDRRRDRHRHAGRSHQVSRAARQSLFAADAHLDARQHRRTRDTASRRRTWPASCRGTPTTC